MTQKEFIPVFQAVYGGTKKEAIRYYKSATTEQKNELLKGFKQEAKKSFYVD